MSSFYFPPFDGFNLDDCEEALAEYFLRLEFLGPKVDQELTDALGAWRACEELEATLQREFNAMVQAALEHVQVEPPAPGEIARLALPIVYTPGAAAAEVRAEALRLQAESAAGALLLMLDEVLQRLRHRTPASMTGEAPHPREFAVGPLGVADKVSTLIYAAGNAYRHAKDWEGLVDATGTLNEQHREYKRARPTLDLLMRSIDLVRVSQGSACVASVERLTHGGTGDSPVEVLWGRLVDAGRDYAEAYADGAASFEKVVGALEAQREYARIQVSFSGDENLWVTNRRGQ